MQLEEANAAECPAVQKQKLANAPQANGVKLQDVKSKQKKPDAFALMWYQPICSTSCWYMCSIIKHDS